MSDSPEVILEDTPEFPVSIQLEGESTPRRLSGSGFSIVINTNKQPVGTTDRELLRDEIFRRADLLQAMEKIRRDPNIGNKIFNFNAPFASDRWAKPFIIRVVLDKPTTELGTNKFGGRVHGNMSFRITHYTNIHVDRNRLESEVLGHLLNPNITSLHINIRAFRLNAVTLSRYNRKEQETPLGRSIARRAAELGGF